MKNSEVEIYERLQRMTNKVIFDNSMAHTEFQRKLIKIASLIRKVTPHPKQNCPFRRTKVTVDPSRMQG